MSDNQADVSGEVGRNCIGPGPRVRAHPVLFYSRLSASGAKTDLHRERKREERVARTCSVGKGHALFFLIPKIDRSNTLHRMTDARGARVHQNLWLTNRAPKFRLSTVKCFSLLFANVFVGEFARRTRVTCLMSGTLDADGNFVRLECDSRVQSVLIATLASHHDILEKTGVSR